MFREAREIVSELVAGAADVLDAGVEAREECDPTPLAAVERCCEGPTGMSG
jgi:hypothetical protein